MGFRSRLFTLVPSRSSSVHAHGLAAVTFAVLEHILVVVRRHVLEYTISMLTKQTVYCTYPIATHHIVDVLTQFTSLVSSASTEAELFLRDEGSPLVILQSFAERISVHKSADWVTGTLSTVRIKFTSAIESNSLRDNGEPA